MTDPTIPADSLVLYKGRPARVIGAGDKLTIELTDGGTQRVRPKDVVLLHPGPLRSLAELTPTAGEVETAWEMLAAESDGASGVTVNLAELAELAFSEFTPASAWATWQLVIDGLLFRGEPEAITVCSADEVARTRAARAAEAEERSAWEAFLARAQTGALAAEDERYLRDIEDLALGRTERSRVLQGLKREESYENAHATLLEYGFWDVFVNPYPVRLGLPAAPPDLPVPSLSDEPRRDLTHLPAYAIDDEGSDTPDDALSLDGDRLWVHIADVAALVPPDSPIDIEARARGATSHLPERIVPMLPPGVTPLLGLGLAEISPALSFGLDLGSDGAIVGLEMVPSWVRVRRLTYGAANARLEEEPFRTLHAMAEAYRARRLEAGAVELDFPEVRIQVNAGEVTIRPLPTLPSRSLVEGAMIMTGEAVAEYALAHEIPLPYATQEASEENGRPETLSGMFALRRTLKRSQYRSGPAPHAGLGLAAYAQATSPLRRYLDLVLHQQLRAHLRGEPVLDTTAILERVGAMEAVIGDVRRAESLSNRHWTLVYLMQHPDWQGEGVVVDKRGRGGKVIIPELAYEARVHLPGDPPLDSRVVLLLTGVDLPRLDARFRVVG